MISRIFLVFLFATSTALAAPSEKGQYSEQSRLLNEEGVKAVKAKDFKKAEKLFRNALSSDQGNLSAVFNLAGMYMTNKKEQQAIHLLKEYTEKVPDDAGLYTRLGDSYFAAKDIAGAQRSYNKAYKLDPAYSKLASKLATISTLKKDLKSAEKYFLEAVDQDPKNGQLLANLSSVLLANGKADKAIGVARRALRVRATSEVYVTLGSAYESIGDQKNAAIAYERAIDLGDKRDELQEKLDDVRASLKK